MSLGALFTSRRMTDIPWLTSSLPSLYPKYPPPPVTSTFPLEMCGASADSSPSLGATQSLRLQLDVTAPFTLWRRATAGLGTIFNAGWLTHGWCGRLGRFCMLRPLACRRTLERGSCFTWHREPPLSLMLRPHSSISWWIRGWVVGMGLDGGISHPVCN